jgi:hypothetical protein
MEDHFMKAIDLASDLSKQVLTLSTALLAWTATFKRDTVGAPIALLKAAWTLLLISVLCGIWSLMALTGVLAPVTGPAPNNLGPSVRIPAAAQLVAFGLGMILMIVYAGRALTWEAREKE